MKDVRTQTIRCLCGAVAVLKAKEPGLFVGTCDCGRRAVLDVALEPAPKAAGALHG